MLPPNKLSPMARRVAAAVEARSLELDLSSLSLPELSESIGQLRYSLQLYLSHNRLDALPDSLRELHSLKRLDLYRNDKLGLPYEVLDKTEKPHQILEYYFRVRIDRRPLNEAKLILVGWGGRQDLDSEPAAS